MTYRVMFYVQHLLGIGHVKRAAAITGGLLAQGMDVTVVLGGEPVTLAGFGGAELIQLPSARARDESFSVLLDEHGQPIDKAWQRRRRALLLDHFERLQPDLILVEHFPFGRRKFKFELLPLFERAKTRSLIFSSVRDVLIENPRTERVDEMLAMAQKWFDHILVHGDPSLITFDETFPKSNALASIIHYTGYVVAPDEQPDGPSKEETGEIIVSIGGGIVGEALMRTALEVCQNGVLADHTWRFLAGGNLHETVFTSLCKKAPDNAVVERARPDFRVLLQHCALSISQGGYNTMMDILHAGCAALIVPFASGNESEQGFRARRLAERGLITVLEERMLDVPTLTANVQTAFDKGRQKTTAAIDLNGVENSAIFIKQQLSSVTERRQ